MTILKLVFSPGNLVFLAAVATGVFLPEAETTATLLLLPALTVILTLAILSFPKGYFQIRPPLLTGLVWGNVLCYFLLANLILIGSLFLIRDEGLWIGIVLVIAVPPSATLIASARRVGADESLAFAGLSGTHLGALALVPIIGLAFLKYIPVEPGKLAMLIACLVVLPLLLSKAIVDNDRETLFEKHSGPACQVCYFVVFYALAAANADWLLSRPTVMAHLAGIALAATVLAHAAIRLMAKIGGIPRDRMLSLLLLGTLKHYALAGAVALFVFGPDTARAALIFSPLALAYTTVFEAVYLKRPTP